MALSTLTHAMHAAVLQSGLAPTAFWCATSASLCKTYCCVNLSKLCLLLMSLPQDIARATFCRLTEDIHALKARYQEQHRLNDLKVRTRVPSHPPYFLLVHSCAPMPL